MGSDPNLTWIISKAVYLRKTVRQRDEGIKRISEKHRDTGYADNQKVTHELTYRLDGEKVKNYGYAGKNRIMRKAFG